MSHGTLRAQLATLRIEMALSAKVKAAQEQAEREHRAARQRGRALELELAGEVSA